jgi:hypothetical protein
MSDMNDRVTGIQWQRKEEELNVQKKRNARCKLENRHKRHFSKRKTRAFSLGGIIF